LQHCLSREKGKYKEEIINKYFTLFHTFPTIMILNFRHLSTKMLDLNLNQTCTFKLGQVENISAPNIDRTDTMNHVLTYPVLSHV